jgi:hypothetical protein
VNEMWPARRVPAYPPDAKVPEVRRGRAPARISVAAPPAEAAPGGWPLAPDPRRWEWWFPVIAFVVVAGAVVAISVLAHDHLPLLHHRHRQLQGRRWVGAFGWWDGWWYVGIARRGYRFFSPERQSPVAFFPLYPLMIREVARVTGGPLLAGFVVTITSGLGGAVLFHRWCVRKFGPGPARVAVLLLLLYPFAFYLMGAVYADALFLLTAVAAFLALEEDRPVLAGLFAALATATRPVGAALVLGLWVLALERKGVLGWDRPARRPWRELGGDVRPADLGLLLAPAGLVAFCGFLWMRFSRPLAFLDTAGARGWDQPPGFHTWFKVHWVKAMWHGPWDNGHFGHLMINFLATAVAAAFIPAVFRRLGLGYGIYAAIAVVATAVSTKDFVGMGRYTLAAFPCFAVAADELSRRPWLARAALAGSALALAMLAQLHARGTILS